jgi:hypothetical protein
LNLGRLVGRICRFAEVLDHPVHLGGIAVAVRSKSPLISLAFGLPREPGWL